MKKTTIFFMALCAVSFMLSACDSSSDLFDEDSINKLGGAAAPIDGGIMAFSYDISVVNSKGDDLLKPGNPGCVDLSKVKVTYEGDGYDNHRNDSVMGYMPGETEHSYYRPVPPSGSIRNNWDPNLRFPIGLFYSNSGNEKATIEWEDGHKDVLEANVRFDSKSCWFYVDLRLNGKRLYKGYLEPKDAIAYKVEFVRD